MIENDVPMTDSDTSSSPANEETKSVTEILRENPSLRHSIRDGNAFAIMTGTGEAYFGAFGIFLRATALQVGLLASLPAFLGAIVQGLSVLITERSSSRRTVVVRSVAANTAILAVISVFAICGFAGSNAAIVLIVLSSLYFIAIGFGAPAWNSLIGDLVPVKLRARFFAERNRQILMLTFFSLMGAGQILDLSKRWGVSAIGFACIFFIAAVARHLGMKELLLHDDPPYHPDSRQYFRFVDFIRRAPHSNFAKFVFFAAGVSLSAAIAGPYFSLYMLRDLKMSYFEYTLIAASAIATQSVTLGHWSGITDTFGSKRVLNVCSLGVGLVPILWVVSTATWYLILVQLYAGFMWAGYNLAVQNFTFDAVTPQKRARCAAYQGIISGFAVFIGSLAGGYLLDHVRAVTSFSDVRQMNPTPIIIVFLVSGILRLFAVQIMLSKFREVRDVAQVSHKEFFFRVAHVRPIFGFAFSFIPIARPRIGRGVSNKNKQ